MSRLRELRLHGFKTFADPTRFVFEPGVNAVIGPNGSGKSNMADAVRWVLGEQSNRSLRTRRADDVIFAGSEQRKPQGMAEAILTLDNADGWLPIEFAEVSIGRRAYRSGESEYLVNGARARLRDVVSLLGEGRLGANELVVVGQGTVDAALSLRPEERRQLFEEAAGVKNLQVRKHEALARLGRARDNLTRVTDLIAELKPQVRRLALQAEHQQEHDALGRRARALVGESHRRREAAAREALGGARRRAAAAETSLEEQRAREIAARDEIAAAEAAYWQAEAAARTAARERETTREQLIRGESRLEAASARFAELASVLDADERELAAADTALPAAGGETPDVADALAEAAAAEEGWRAASAALAAADAALVAAEEALADARRRSGERIALDAQREELGARAQGRRDLLDRELAEAEAAEVAAASALGPAQAAAEVAAQSANAARGLHEAALAALSDAQPRADAARHHAAELAERVGAMAGELEALGERAARRSQLGSRMAAAGWSTLLDAVSAPDDAWPAIEAVLGGELEEALVWRAGDPPGELHDTGGVARLLALEDGAASRNGDERTAALRAVGARQTLAEKVIGDKLPAIFGRTVIAPDVEALVRGWRDLPRGWAAVTADGDLADERGIVTLRGRAGGRSGEAARRHARQRELSDGLESIQAEQEAATAEAARAMAAVREAARALERVRIARAKAESAEMSAAAELETATSRRERAAERLAELRAEADRADAELLAARPPAADGEPAAGDTDVPGLDARARAARISRGEAEEARNAAREAWQAARTRAAELEGRHQAGGGDRLLLEARRAQLAASLPARRVAQASLASEATALAAEVEVARQADAGAATAVASAEAAQEAARSALLELERAAGGGPGRLADLERGAGMATVDVSRQEEALAALAREREASLESLADLGQAVPEPDADADAAAGPDLAALDAENLEAELRRVRRTLAQIGSVNPFAVEEHRELSGRLGELSTQDSDLSAAIDGTEELIARLEAEITQQFNAAFAAIGEKFDEFCRLLFAGGSASLQLGGGEDGEAPGGIEIVVRPPGKRLQRLAMLSGGERALTGVALLFAMLSVNPIPFCILDEVDAALDEANIGRFADALRMLAEQIDFVVITHNRATIEVADTIYGVTMSDAAVSRVVSLRLADLPAEVVA